MLRDLKALVDAGLTHITHYELNVAGRTDFSRNRRDELPSTEQNLEMYRIGRDFLVSAGFTQVTPYDFQHSGPLSSSYLYEELFRQPFREDDGQLVGYDAWGWGFAGISFFFGTTARSGMGLHEPDPRRRLLPRPRRGGGFRWLRGFPLLGGRPPAAPAVSGAPESGGGFAVAIWDWSDATRWRNTARCGTRWSSWGGRRSTTS